MALTSEQESILEEIIDAYENGKRLSDLPEATGEDPQNMYVEVLEDGESKKARLGSMLPYEEDEVSYGIQRSIYDSSPTCTRVGNMTLHKTLPVQSLMRGCLLDDDGNVVEYLPDDSWEGATLDGSKGQVMVEIPLHYRKCSLLDDGTMEVRLSLYPIAGYEQVPKVYVSAYEATVQRSTNKLSSVKSEDTDYRGGNNNADRDGTYQTQLGMAATAISMTNFRTYARNRGTAGKNGCGWNSLLYSAERTIYWLFVVEYATLNSQAGYNAELTEDGYHQGGLGNGVTTINSTYWSNFNGQYPVVPIGWTDSLGNRTGIVEYTMPEEYEASLTFNVPRYRGLENLFGHIYKWFADVLVIAHPSEEYGGNLKNDFYVCDDPSKFSSSSVADYAFVGTGDGNATAAWLYPTKMMFGKDGDFFGSDSGGSTSTYLCDGNYVDNSITADTIRGLYFGGRASSGASAGLACVNSYRVPSSTAAYIGSRLCFLPE